MLNELNDRLAKMPYLDGYQMTQNDKDMLSKVGQPPIQHPHVLRWFNQVSFETGANQPKKEEAPTSAQPPQKAPGSGHSKNTDPTILPKSSAQRDAKTGQLKEDPIYVAHRNKMFGDLLEAQKKRYDAMPQ